MGNEKYPNLSKPIKLGNVVAKNRIFGAPAGMMSYTSEGHLTLDNRAFYELRASGGAASVSLGECIVHPTGTSHAVQPKMYDPSLLPSLTSVAKDIKRHGALATLELSHGGKYGGISSLAGEDPKGQTAYGPSEEFTESGEHVYEMPKEIIREIEEAYGKAAAMAKSAGFNMVNVHAAHGWLFCQFLSPKQNHRTDEYGGSLENRARFFLETIDEVRKAVGKGFPIEVRMNGDDFYEGGMHIEDYVEFAKLIGDKVDLINVSCGDHEIPELFLRTHPHGFLEHGCNVYLAAEVKKVVNCPVSCVGALNDPAQMEEIIASGKADIVELGRELMADPFLPKKTFEGREDEITPCQRCYECFHHAIFEGGIKCAVNPLIGNELDAKSYNPPTPSRKVLVVGGGPGGMQAAIEASERGHQVILCEKTDELGGMLKYSKDVDFKADLYKFVRSLITRLEKTSVKVRFNTTVTKELVKEIGPDVIIAATGALPAVPPIEGIDGDNVISAVGLDDDIERVGERCVILGGGLVGCEAAIHLGRMNKKVTVVEMLPEVMTDCNDFHRLSLLMELEKNAEVMTDTRVASITPNGLEAADKDGTPVSIEADTIICAAGMKSDHSFADSVRDLGIEVYEIGDAVRPAKVGEAMTEGYYCAKYL